MLLINYQSSAFVGLLYVQYMEIIYVSLVSFHFVLHQAAPVTTYTPYFPHILFDTQKQKRHKLMSRYFFEASISPKYYLKIHFLHHRKHAASLITKGDWLTL
jgi:hypothetical protein